MIQQIAHLGLLEDEAIVLDAAALELAALDHPDVDIGPYVETLEEMSERLHGHSASARTARQRADALSELLGGQYGFAGDRDSYDDPANADMIRVLDRRRGLPVSLSILYVAAARRVGWQAEALNTPGHVLVRIGPDPDPVLVDPFGGGALVHSTRLAALLTGAVGEGAEAAPEHLAAMSNRAVLVRLLTNQATRAEQAEDSARALILYERMTTIAPSHGHAWWERARLELVEGRVGAARASLSAMLEVTRDPIVRSHVTAALDAIAGSSG